MESTIPTPLKATKPTINHLPIEIFVEIFTYLSFTDQIFAATVCSLWETLLLENDTLKKSRYPRQDPTYDTSGPEWIAIGQPDSIFHCLLSDGRTQLRASLRDGILSDFRFNEWSEAMSYEDYFPRTPESGFDDTKEQYGFYDVRPRRTEFLSLKRTTSVREVINLIAKNSLRSKVQRNLRSTGTYDIHFRIVEDKLNRVKVEGGVLIKSGQDYTIPFMVKNSRLVEPPPPPPPPPQLPISFTVKQRDLYETDQDPGKLKKKKLKKRFQRTLYPVGLDSVSNLFDQ
ncbi:hypothetical protein ABW20_dc0103149 [Dactylellina cionopaga]|nr:hypothetical protein ABW20_dc0103149 [Dactylellina cionopaga]